ncbi:MAG: CHAT domain-containing protein [Ardenticatenales bacterium]|nr:CHAT domain-containing protein [Ardenticatenales bacterium]
MENHKVQYLNFDLLVERVGRAHRVRILAHPGPGGDFSDDLPRSRLKAIQKLRDAFLLNPSAANAKKLGGEMFAALFPNKVRDCFDRSCETARDQKAGLRLRLRLSRVPELAVFPWEYLYDAEQNLFLALSRELSLVRYVEKSTPPKPLSLSPPVKILAVLASPRDQPELAIEAEWQIMREALATPEQQGWAQLTRLEQPTIKALLHQLSHESYQVFHITGHGTFDEASEQGVVLLETVTGESDVVTGETLGTILAGLSLVVLNLCEGASGSTTRALAATAEQLIQRGVPAVIAMQATLSDESALLFAEKFYYRLAQGDLVDKAMGEARLALYSQQGNIVEAGIPVLHMRAPDGQLFEMSGNPPAKPMSHLPFVIEVGQSAGKYREMVVEANERMGVLGYGGKLAKWVDQEAASLRHDPKLTPKDPLWKELIQTFDAKISSLRQLPDRPVPHLFLNCPVALAMGFGARLSIFRPVVIYDFDLGGSYQQALDLSVTRSMLQAEPTHEPYYLKVESPPQPTQEVFVLISLSGHGSLTSIQALAKAQGSSVCYLSTPAHRVRNEALWLPLIQETRSFLKGLDRSEVRHVHLCLDTPLAFAFGLGMALGAHSSITLYQWFPGEKDYFPVLDLENVRK